MRRLSAKRVAASKRPPGGFVAMPYVVLRSAQFAALRPSAVKLLMDLLAQYRGHNNGDLCATWSLMHERGWRSRDTLGKALHELTERNWIQQTRQGGMHQPSLYGVTFYELDWSAKLEIAASAFNRGGWSRGPIDAASPRNAQPARRVNPAANDTPSVSIAPQTLDDQHADRVGAAVLVD